MKRDIENTTDITLLVNKFYIKVIDDAVIGYIFKSIPHFSFETHMPIMISFWETLLFGVASYKGNPMLTHIQLHKTTPLQAEHFKQWLYLWEQTTNENFEGKNADEAIAKAKNIGGLMQYKINNTTGIIINK
jgi:hemoglobin